MEKLYLPNNKELAMENKEKQNIEWKVVWKDEYLVGICGFANAQGGKFLIGVDDNGKVVGIKDARKLLESLPSKIRDAMGIVVDVNLCKENNLEYIEIDVPAYPIAISCKGNYYYRSGSTTQKLTGVELESFILRKRGATWDNVPHPLVKIEDLDQSAIQKFKELAIRKKRIDDTILEEDTETLLDKLHLISNSYLTNAALLLFSKDPERYFTGAFIKVGFFETDAEIVCIFDSHLLRDLIRFHAGLIHQLHTFFNSLAGDIFDQALADLLLEHPA